MVHKIRKRVREYVQAVRDYAMRRRSDLPPCVGCDIRRRGELVLCGSPGAVRLYEEGMAYGEALARLADEFERKRFRSAANLVAGIASDVLSAAVALVVPECVSVNLQMEGGRHGYGS